MRLIDADALIAEMHNIILEDGEDRRIFYEVIERQPTIEPKKEVKTPRWVAEDRFVKGKYFLFPHCPKCNGELTTGQCYCSICGQHIGWDEEEGADG